MKYEYYSIASDYESGQDGDILAILDWDWFYNPASCEYRNRSFTGKHYKSFYFSFTLFRKKHVLCLTWAHKQTTPELAKKLYHSQFKNKSNA